MFGLTADWSNEVHERYFTLGDYAGGEARWCPGCGDHGILTAVQRICRDEQIPPEKTVAVSGIGCSSRLPHYMGTYGFHGLHGRALPVACGIKARRPDLDVWVATGDGDCFSIGAAHWLHAIRYNMDMTLLVFDNAVYGLTKKQTSPTSPMGFRTNTHPTGAILSAHNPLTVTLAITNVSFMAQTIDWNPVILYETLKAAHQHKGTSFVRIIQRCPVYAKTLSDELQNDPTRFILLKSERGIPVDKKLLHLFPNQKDHDPFDKAAAFAAADDASLIPVGLIYHDPDVPIYEDLSNEGSELSVEERLAGINRVFDRIAV